MAQDTNLFKRKFIPKFKQNGPAIIEQLDTTIVIHPKDNFLWMILGTLLLRYIMIKVDKITLGVIQAGLQQVCDEMDLSFSRSAFSPVISEANDRSNGIYSAINGSLISQGYNGLPVFVGTMEYSTSEIIRLIKEEKVEKPDPGDIYIVNDPYLGGTHLMDVRFANHISEIKKYVFGCQILDIGLILVGVSLEVFLLLLIQ